MMEINKIPWRRASNIGGKGPWVPQLSCGVQITCRSPRPSSQVFFFQGDLEDNMRETLTMFWEEMIHCYKKDLAYELSFL